MADATHNVGIRLNGDASGLVGATKTAGQATKDLAEQFRKSGEATKQNTAEADAFVKRLREQADTLGKNKQQVEAYRAAQLNLTDQQKKAVDSSLEQIRTYERKEQVMQKLASAARVVGVALGLALSATVALGKSAIDEADRFNKLSQSIGMSTEALSVYGYAGKLADVSQEEFTVGMKTLAKNVAEARGGMGDGARIFNLLGREIDTAVRSGASLEQLLPMIADRFAGAADGPNKTALAIALLGRAGEALIPLLNQGAGGIGAVKTELEKMGRVISGQTARQAEEFNDNITKLTTSLTAFKYQVNEFLPGLNRFVELMLKLTQIGTNPIQAAFIAARSQMSGAEIDARIKELEESTKNAGTPVSGFRQSIRYSIPGVATYDALSGINESLAIQELAALRAMRAQSPSGSQASVRAVDNALLKGSNKDFGVITPNDAAVREIAARGESYQDRIDREARKVANDRGVQLLKEAEEAYKANAKAAGDAATATAKWYEEQHKGIEQLNDGNKTLREQNEEIGLTAEQLGKLRVKREEDALGRLRQEEAWAAAQPGEEAYLRLIQQQITALEERVQLTRKNEGARVIAEQAEKAREEWKRTNETIQRGLTDALMRGWESGKSFAENFRDSVVNMFKTLVLEPVIRFIVSPVSGAISSALGGMGGSLGGGGGGGLGNVLSLGNNLFGGSGSIGNFIGGLGDGAVGNFLGGLTGGAGLSGTILADSIMAEMVGGAALGASGAAAGAGALSFLGPAGLAVGALAMTGMFDDLFGGGDDSHSDPRWDPKALEHFDPRYGGTPTPAPSWFDSEAYLAANPDVQRLYGFNPYDHYTAWGQGEGRKLAPDGWAEQKAAAKAAEEAAIAADEAARVQAEAAKKAEEVARQIAQLVDVEQRLSSQLTSSVRALPGQLGITSLEQYQASLSVGEDRAPLDRLASARSIYEAAIAKARGGDLDAVQSLSGVAQQLFAIGRDTYASGSGFQEIRGQIERDVGSVLNQQMAVQAEILRDVPTTIMEAARDQIGEIIKMKNALVDELRSMRSEILRLEAY